MASLNSQQRRAVESRSRRILVAAGPGSGKTRVVESRCRDLVSMGVPPESILLLTFTRKAAEEMKARACASDSRCAAVSGGTFHSWGVRLLRKHGGGVMPAGFTVIDDGDCQDALHKAAGDLGFLEDKKEFPGKGHLSAIRSAVTNCRWSVRKAVEKRCPAFADKWEAVGKVLDRYARYKRTMKYVDFDDILDMTDMVLDDSKVRQAVSSAISHVLVDEYQDVNPVQASIVEKLYGAGCEIMVVGDDAQSIYRFRGADRRQMMEFPGKGGTEIVELGANYRSTSQILALASAIMDTMEDGFGKGLHSAPGKAGPRPVLRSFVDPIEEARGVAAGFHGRRPSDCAVLARSSYALIPVQVELAKRGVPFVVRGGLRLSEKVHVRDFLSLVRLLVNPSDELAWVRVLCWLPGVGQGTASKIWNSLAGSFDLTTACMRLTSWTSKKKCQDEASELASALSRAARQDGHKSQVRTLFEYYVPLMRMMHDKPEQREDEMREVLAVADAASGLSGFLEDLVLDKPDMETGCGAVTLSTIHSAKGLEWPFVHVVGMGDGMLPSDRSLGDDEDMEEEKRLLFVAVTRAKDELSLSWPVTRNGQYHEISRFLDDKRVLFLVDRARFDD